MVYRSILEDNGKKLVILVDPCKFDSGRLSGLCSAVEQSGISMIFVGGSLVKSSVGPVVEMLKSRISLPVVPFPGSPLQLASNADAVLLLSLISGRNPEFLIGNHVVSAMMLKESGLEIIPTGYMLVGDGKPTAVEYMSNTRPIPSAKPELAVATAVAGEMLGLRVIYMEAGSGANEPVPVKMIKEVKENISIPLIVGGGIKDMNTLESVFSSGADVAVVGTAFEEGIPGAGGFGGVVKKFQKTKL